MNWLKKLLTDAQMRDAKKTQAGLAKHLGVAPSRISEVARGVRRLQPQEYDGAAEFLEVPLPRIVALANGKPDPGGPSPPLMIEHQKLIEHRNDDATIKSAAILKLDDSEKNYRDDEPKLGPLPLWRSRAMGTRGQSWLLGEVKVGEVERPAALAFRSRAFAVEAVDNSHAPHCWARDTLKIDPDATVVPADNYLFVKPTGPKSWDAIVRYLVRETPSTWVVVAWSAPKREIELSKSEWKEAWRVRAVERP